VNAMDDQTLVVILRGAERILVDLGGALAVYLGYQLFLRMPSRERGEGKFELPGGISIYVSRVGPGVFFSLFGAAILGLSLVHGVSQDSTRSIAAGAPAAGVTSGEVAAAAPGIVVQSTHYAGAAASAPPVDPLQAEAERDAVVLAIRNINRVPAALRAELPAAQRLDIEQAIAATKLRLLKSVWDQDQWGDFVPFRQWVDQGENDPPPPAIARAVAVYQAGKPASSP
ncbi:MAG TPA: hypothetical protein VLA85_00045, partial [Verrucomicrobiae bacterium]|jgi:hypothetical protein|nr:hypothetical protein [Verrucomicrobiae bacterium]